MNLSPRPDVEQFEADGPLTRKDALFLFQNAELTTLGTLADGIRRRLHPEDLVTFVVDRNVNYTNVCVSRCRFCAFYRDQGAPDSYALTMEEILRKVGELADQGGTQLLMQGGLHPGLGIEYFENLFREIKAHYPGIHIHSLSPAEIRHIADLSGITVAGALRRLHQAGLDSLPGGGAEILVDRVRNEISPRKIGWKGWSEVMLEAARQGLRTTATMMFGCGERPEEIVEHLFRVREIQNDGGSFTAFIPWSYQPGNTELGGTAATGVEYLKVLALSRIVLDNIPNIQASWVTQGAKLAQAALFFGANDMGGTMLEENVVAAAGCAFRMSRKDLVEIIEAAGFRAAQRTTSYNLVEHQ